MIEYKRIMGYIIMIYLVIFTTGCEVRQTFVEETDPKVTSSMDKQVKLIDEGPSQGGTLTLFTTPVDTLNPYMTKNRYITHIAFFLYESLFIQSDESQAVPWLVSDWEQKNFLDWTFSIKEDIFFHHGQELTAYDIRHTLRVLENSDSLFYYSGLLKNIQEINIINSTQFEIKLIEPDDALIQKLIFPILSQTVELENKGFVSGTGPYKLESMDDSIVRLTRNEQWWNSEPPYLDSVHFKVYHEDQMVDAFQNNEIDIAFIKNVDFSKYHYRTDIYYQVYPDNEGNFLYVNPNSLFGKSNRQEYLFRYVAHRIHDMNVGQVEYFEQYRESPMDIDDFREALIQSGLSWNKSRGVFTEQNRTVNRMRIIVPRQELQKLHTANFLVNILEDAGIQAEIVTAGEQEVMRAFQNGGYDLSPVTEELRPWESLADTLQRMKNDLGYGKDSYILPLYRNRQAILFKNSIRGEKNSIFWNPYQGFHTWYMPVFVDGSVNE